MILRARGMHCQNNHGLTLITLMLGCHRLSNNVRLSGSVEMEVKEIMVHVNFPSKDGWGAPHFLDM